MLSRLALCALALLLVAAPRAYAQEYSPLRWYIMGGANVPLSNTADILQTGYNFGFAVTWREPGHPVGVRFDFNYASNNATRELQNQGSQATGLNITGGWADIWSASVNLEAQHLFSPTTINETKFGVNRSNYHNWGYGTAPLSISVSSASFLRSPLTWTRSERRKHSSAWRPPSAM